jgi:hypothetical protein
MAPQLIPRDRLASRCHQWKIVTGRSRSGTRIGIFSLFSGRAGRGVSVHRCGLV